MRTLGFIAGLSVVLSCLHAKAEHTHEGDFELRVEFDSVIVAPRVLPAELEAEEFFSTDEPGFDAAPGTFPAGSSIGFNILDALKRWNGGGFDPLTPETQETMTISFLQRVCRSGSGLVAGFELAAASDGSWHRHLMFTLNGPGANDPQKGIYLLELELYTINPVIGAAYPVYIVFNVDDEPNHEPALEWVRENLAGPVCVQKPIADLNGDCKVDFQDFVIFAESWLSHGLRP
ncbi:MAG: hypothetical protein ABIF19_03750 [Planctomycetota bacterium]